MGFYKDDLNVQYYNRQNKDVDTNRYTNPHFNVDPKTSIRHNFGYNSNNATNSGYKSIAVDDYDDISSSSNFDDSDKTYSDISSCSNLEDSGRTYSDISSCSNFEHSDRTYSDISSCSNFDGSDRTYSNISSCSNFEDANSGCNNDNFPLHLNEICSESSTKHSNVSTLSEDKKIAEAEKHSKVSTLREDKKIAEAEEVSFIEIDAWNYSNNEKKKNRKGEKKKKKKEEIEKDSIPFISSKDEKRKKRKGEKKKEKKEIVKESVPLIRSKDKNRKEKKRKKKEKELKRYPPNDWKCNYQVIDTNARNNIMVTNLKSLDKWLGDKSIEYYLPDVSDIKCCENSLNSVESSGTISKLVKHNMSNNNMKVSYEKSLQEWIYNRKKDSYGIFTYLSSFSHVDAQKPFCNEEKYYFVDGMDIDLVGCSFSELDTKVSKCFPRKMTTLEYKLQKALNSFHYKGNQKFVNLLAFYKKKKKKKCNKIVPFSPTPYRIISSYQTIPYEWLRYSRVNKVHLPRGKNYDRGVVLPL